MSEEKSTNLAGHDKIKFLKKQIMKSGFPLQLEISSLLRKRGYDVYNGVYFFDRDEKKTREFDIEAVLPFESVYTTPKSIEEAWFLNPFLLIECKKSTMYSWVFFRSEPIGTWFDIGHSIDVLTETHGYMKSACGKILTTIDNLHYHFFDTVIVSAYQQIKLEKYQKNKDERDGKDAILDAISKIIKFMDYRFQNLKPFFTKDSPRRDIIFYFPMVVFDGDLFEASFKETLDLKECRHVVYETRYLSSLTKSLVPLYIDIVRKDAFEDVISTIEKEVRDINIYLEKPGSQNKLSSIINS